MSNAIRYSRRGFLEVASILGTLTAGPSYARRDPSDELDAVGMCLAVAERRTTSAELVDTAIARLEAVNPTINAVTLKCYHQAREAARKALGPMNGVPTLIKGNRPQKGLPYTQGSRAYRNRIASETSADILSVERAGFISLGRTALPEFGLSPTTEAQISGLTRNPWNLERSCGGSSGGSAAAVAAGVVPVAYGNDGAGSIRIPAAACGLVGLKLSRSFTAPGVPQPGGLSVNGCLSRTVRDTAAWLATVNKTDLVQPSRLGRLRITAQLAPPAGGVADDSVAKVFAEALALLSRLGHRVQETAIPYDGLAFIDGFLRRYEGSAARSVAAFETWAGRPATDEDLEPLTLGLAMRGRNYAEEQIAKDKATMLASTSAYVDLFKDTDIHVTPVLSTPAVLLGTFGPQVDYESQRDQLITYATYSFIHSAAGTPSIALPIGQSADGMPIGMQFGAAVGHDSLLLELAYTLEREIGWSTRRPRLWAGGRLG